MQRILVALIVVLFATPVFAQQSPEEQSVWKLENAYWKYVQAMDLEAYRNLWHPNFIGWPQSSATPARKGHITDWIKEATAHGERLQSYELKQAGIQFTENVVVTHYWSKETWVTKDGVVSTDYSRITHTWLRVKDGWQIIGGMSAPIQKSEP